MIGLHSVWDVFLNTAQKRGKEAGKKNWLPETGEGPSFLAKGVK